MAICKFFENGYCKFGDRCRFEHISPANNQNSRFSFNIKNQNNPTGNYQLISSLFDGVVDIDDQCKCYPDTLHGFLSYQSSSGTASSFSFTKTLQAVAQPAQPTASNFSFGNIQSSNRNNNFSGNSFFQHQPHQTAQPVVAKAASSFSFNQLLKQKVEISDAQMDGDLDFPNSTPVKSFFPSQSGAIVSSTPFASGFAFGNASAAPIPNSLSQQQRPFFGQPQPNQQTKSSFFGLNQSNPPQNPTSFFGASTTATSEHSTKSSPIYSKLNQLSDESRKHYEAKSFSMIPLQPPPYELCF